MSYIDKKSLVSWARTMIECGARSATVKSITGLPDAQCKRIYKEVLESETAGPRGQMPSSVNWFTKTASLCFSSAVFVKFFEVTLADMGNSELAFGHAYYHYFRLIGSPKEIAGPTALDPERANYLRKHFANPKAPGGSSLSPLKLCKCKKCQSQFVGLTSAADRMCPICEPTP